MAVEMNVAYTGALCCEAVHGPSGEHIVTEAPVDNGGRGLAFSPTDLVGASVAACMLTIMGKVAERIGVDISGAKANVVKEMTTESTRRIAGLRVTITLPEGREYPPDVRTRLANAAKTCPVKESLHPDVNIETVWVYPS